MDIGNQPVTSSSPQRNNRLLARKYGMSVSSFLTYRESLERWAEEALKAMQTAGPTDVAASVGFPVSAYKQMIECGIIGEEQADELGLTAVVEDSAV